MYYMYECMEKQIAPTEKKILKESYPDSRWWLDTATVYEESEIPANVWESR